MSVKERIKEFIKSENITISDFEKQIKVANGYVNSISKGIGTEKIKIILEHYPNLNLEWLITGNGSMLRNQNVQNKLNNSIEENIDNIENIDLQHKDIKNSGITKIINPKEKTRKKLIPFYDIEAAAGTLQISDMTPVTEPDEWINAGDWFLDADSAMRVHGDSMFPVYKSGSIVVMREVYDKQLVIYGQDYMIETLEYRMIKRLQKSNMTGNWLACSINEETWGKGELAGRLIHEPFDVSIDNVIKLCRVLGCVTRNEGSRIVYTKNKSKV